MRRPANGSAAVLDVFCRCARLSKEHMRALQRINRAVALLDCLHGPGLKCEIINVSPVNGKPISLTRKKTAVSHNRHTKPEGGLIAHSSGDYESHVFRNPMLRSRWKVYERTCSRLRL